MNASPAEMAAQLAHQPGLIWLDSALQQGTKSSLITANPTEIIQGNIKQDWERLENLHQEGTARSAPGGLFGWVGFDGNFTLGHYPHVLRYDHDLKTWSEVGHLSQSLQTPKPLNKELPKLSFSPQLTSDLGTLLVATGCLRAAPPPRCQMYFAAASASARTRGG